MKDACDTTLGALLNGTQTLVIDLTFARTTPSRWVCLRARLPSTNVACSDVNETC